MLWRLAVLGVVVVALAGCGDEGGSGDNTPESFVDTELPCDFGPVLEQHYGATAEEPGFGCSKEALCVSCAFTEDALETRMDFWRAEEDAEAGTCTWFFGRTEEGVKREEQGARRFAWLNECDPLE